MHKLGLEFFYCEKMPPSPILFCWCYFLKDNKSFCHHKLSTIKIHTPQMTATFFSKKKKHFSGEGKSLTQSLFEYLTKMLQKNTILGFLLIKKF